jgi:hypothetical protein
MTVRYSTTRHRRTRYAGQSPSTTHPLSTVPSFPPSPAEKAIGWLSVVDEFKVREHRNIFPRWSFVMIVLAVMAI